MTAETEPRVEATTMMCEHETRFYLSFAINGCLACHAEHLEVKVVGLEARIAELEREAKEAEKQTAGLSRMKTYIRMLGAECLN